MLATSVNHAGLRRGVRDLLAEVQDKLRFHPHLDGVSLAVAIAASHVATGEYRYAHAVVHTATLALARETFADLRIAHELLRDARGVLSTVI